MRKSSAYGESVSSERWLLLSIVAACVVMVSIALLLETRDTPREKAEKQLATLSDDYYIEYLYPRLLGNLSNNPAEVLSEFTETGVPVTYLRQLLHYNDDEHAEMSETFAEIDCDTNMTGVKYYPVEPYGPRDYKITYTWSCEQEREAEEKAKNKDTGRVEKIEKPEDAPQESENTDSDP